MDNKHNGNGHNGHNGHNGKGHNGHGAISALLSPCCDDDFGTTAVADDELAPMKEAVSAILAGVGEDPRREGLVRTPLRVAKAYKFLTSGYDQSVEEILNGAVFTEQYDEIVAVKNIQFFSLCEHHMLPFYGVASIGYIPDGKVVGLSKIPRILEMFARRLQVQERLTTDVANCLNEVLRPRGVAVVMEAYHMCMMMRGVEKQDATTVTSCMLGDFRSSPQTRSEFLTLCGRTSLAR